MGSQTKQRPLSPHLQVYRPQITSVMSILHRMTGIGNMIGLLLFSWWLIAAATGPEAYDTFTGFITSWLGYLLLFGWTLSVCYHMFNGIRHLIWDTGYLLELRSAAKAGITVLALTVILTAIIWLSQGLG